MLPSPEPNTGGDGTQKASEKTVSEKSQRTEETASFSSGFPRERLKSFCGYQHHGGTDVQTCRIPVSGAL